MAMPRLLAALLILAAALTSVGACSSRPSVQTPPAEQDLPASADRIFDEMMARYRLPGMAMGVIVDGKVVHTRVAGELVAGSNRKIDNDSLFKIASNSKAMTTALLARLVEAGKLRWEDPVTRHLPGFKMSDPWVTQQIQVRDLLIHNTGLREGAGDLMLWPTPNNFTRADILAGLAHLKPQQSFRSQYAYDNLMYVVAGEVAAAAGGASYEELMRREIFEPLGMTRCQVGAWDRDLVGNVAQPHMRQGDGNVPIRADGERIPVDTAAAAGGIRCSLNDMLTWMRVWLGDELKTTTGATWLSPSQRRILWSAHTPMPLSQRQRVWDGSHINAYGYGWRLSDVDGSWRVAHTGTLAGMFSAVNLFPDRKAGFVFMINGDGSKARTVLNTALAKLIIAPDKLRSIDGYASELESNDGAATSQPPDTASRTPETLESMAPWLGVYRDPWFGEVSICNRDQQIVFASAKSPQLSGKLMRVAGAGLLVDWDQDDIDTEAWLNFTSTAQLFMRKVDPNADFSYDFEDLEFTRVGSCPEINVKTQIDQLMSRYDGPGPGASLLIVRDGKPFVRRSYGFANLNDRTPAAPDTNYRLASVSKQFTAAAILLLAEDGKLNLDDSLRKWFPSLPNVATEMTIRQVLSHMSGLIDYEDVIPPDMTQQLHDADVLEILETQNRTYFPPGKGYRYSNSGYALLALLMGKASGKDFATFLKNRIFIPLGMTNTVAYEEGISTVKNRAFGYSEEQARWTQTDQSQTSAVLGDGGIYSSIDDLAKWDAALYDDRLLTDKSRALAFTPVTDTDDPTVRYGMGWRITDEPIGGRTLWHSGETIGFRNVIVRYPEQRLTIVLLTNRNDPEPYQTARAIGNLLLK
nr:serine hydrolase domain-containing protein [Steroidobacter agaridevorans]